MTLKVFLLSSVLLAGCTVFGQDLPSGLKMPGLQQSQSTPQQTTAQPAVAPAPQKAAAPTGNRKLSYDLKISGQQPWTDTGIDLQPGDKVTVTGQGLLDYATAKSSPEGLARSWREVVTTLPVNSAGVGALIGAIGQPTVEVPFLIGSSKEITANHSGRLYLGVNQPSNEAGQGTYNVHVAITPATGTATAQAHPLKLPSDLFSKIPRRISDQNGNPGDMVNFLVVGSEQQLQKAFADAGWVAVDKTKAGAVLHALFSTYSKKTYTEMPMSELYLFGRSQDFGYARADPVQVVQTRHHLRIWKAPFEVDGQPVWVGAATHDIGFEHDNRKQGAFAITHKIDPNVDAEREFVGETLNATGDLTAAEKVTPSDPLREAKTATGGTFHSDGQVLVMQLK